MFRSCEIARNGKMTAAHLRFSGFSSQQSSAEVLFSTANAMNAALYCELVQNVQKSSELLCCRMEVMAQDPGFVFDEASGLYFHASSGFYHDANAGWYYNTNDGIYYKFEEGTYIPIASKVNSDNAVSNSETIEDLKIKSTNSHEMEPSELASQESGLLKSAEDVTRERAPASKCAEGCDVSQGNTPTGKESDSQADIAAVEVGFPLWHYDSLQSIYWYYDKETRAYYKYHEEAHNVLQGTSTEGENTANFESYKQESIDIKEISGLESGEAGGGEGERISLQETTEQGQDEAHFRPTSGWVEETLIDLYLKGYPSDSAEKDNGPWITSADIFSEGMPGVSSHVNAGYWESYNSNSFLPDDQLSCPDSSYDMGLMQASIDESDNEGSEELEEGEWVPDEPLRIVDGSLDHEQDQAYMHHDESLDIESLESMHSAKSNGENGSYNEDLEEGEVEDGEIEQDNGDTRNIAEGELPLEEQKNNTGDNHWKKEEDQWKAQFGQVVREKAREHVIPGAVDLWDWTIVEMEPKSLKTGKLVKKLVGRIASSVTKLVSASSGLIRTSGIRATELDYVKVSSGKIYRLRRASVKHLNSLGTYDSSNPTKDWGFPVLGLSLVDKSGEHSLESGAAAQDQSEQQRDILVSKPFVPNTNHWQFQRLLSTSTKKGRVMPSALLASKHLTPEEILMNEQRKQKYRDRAAERRTLHRGFGVGPGQKGLTPYEQDKLDADNAVGMEGALKKAALAPALGRDNVGKRMLEGMGWKEGQTLGVEGGLAAPLQAQGNDGRAGLGWR